MIELSEVTNATNTHGRLRVESDGPGREQSLRGHETCAVTWALTVRRNTPVPPRFVACESNATSGPPFESAIAGFWAD